MSSYSPSRGATNETGDRVQAHPGSKTELAAIRSGETNWLALLLSFAHRSD